MSGIFVDASLSRFPGTLTLDAIALDGSAVTPHPAIIISFRSFDTVWGSRSAAAQRSPIRRCSKAKACNWGATRYFDAGGFVGRTIGLSAGAPAGDVP